MRCEYWYCMAMVVGKGDGCVDDGQKGVGQGGVESLIGETWDRILYLVS